MTFFLNAYRFIADALTTLFANTKSITFDGVNQYMTVPDSDDFTITVSTGFAVTGWFKSNDASVQQSLFRTRGVGAWGTTPGVILEIYSNDFSSNSGAETTTGAYQYVQTTSNPIKSNQWHHVALVLDDADNKVKVYLDGILKATSTGTLSTGTINSSELVQFGSYVGSSRFFDGELDQFVFWDKGLTVEEIKETIAMRDLTKHSAYANIVSWWEFDDADVSGTTVSDRVGSNDGTMVNTPTRTTCVPYPYSYQLYDSTSYENLTPMQYEDSTTYSGFSWDFDGVNDYVTIPDTDDLSFGNGSTDSPFSISAWIKPTDSEAFRIITKNLDGTNMEWTLSTNSSSKLTARLNDLSMFNRIGVDGLPDILENIWTHVLFTYDGSSSNTGMTIYINGENETTNPNVMGSYVALHSLTNEIRIGRNTTTLTSYADGNIGDVIIFDKELSAAEVAAIYNNHEPRDEMNESLSGDIVGYWRGYNSTNTTNGVLDQSGNGNHGTMTNMEDADIVYDFPREAFDLSNGNEGSLDYNGTTQYTTISDSADISRGDGSTDSELSISVWASMDDATNFIFANKTGEYKFFVNASDKLEVRLYDDSASAYIGRTYDTAITGHEGGWHLYEFNYSGSGASTGINLKIDGVVVDDTDSNSGSYTAMENLTNDLTVAYDGTNYADGSITHMSFMGDDLSLCESQENFDKGSPVNPADTTFSTNTISHWALDGRDVSTTCTDIVGSNNGTHTNTPTLSTTDYPTN